jgi:hypothetical protein
MHMNTQHKPHLTLHCNTPRLVAQHAILAAVALFFLIPATTIAADPAGPPAAAKSGAVTLEAIPGSSAKRVILTTKSEQRLGIETGVVGEESLLRKQMVSGLIVTAADKQPEQKPGSGTFGGFGSTSPAPSKPDANSANPVKMPTVLPSGLKKVIADGATQQQPAPALRLVAAAPSGTEAAPASAIAPMQGDAWVRVTLSPGEFERLTKDKPARLLALSTREKLANDLFAQPTGVAPVEDTKRSMLTIYYVVPGQDHGLALNSRVRVELPFAGNEEKQKYVPYSAVYYDGKGAAWVDVKTKPLTYERQRVGVDRVVGDMAVLSEGPPVGTSIVTVGASLLFGTEIFGK